MAASKQSKIGDWIKRFWISFVVFLCLIVLFFFAISMGWLGFMPSFEELENPKSNLASEVISADQELLGKFYIENRSNVHYADLSPALVHALIATEDVRFESHSGIDGRAMFRVLFGMITNTNKGGGSTITQQLAKNLFPRTQHSNIFSTGFSKLKEWITAIKLERNYTKEEIIAMYFNTVDFGSNSYGIKSAAKTFFGKKPGELKVEEAALLVGIVNAPTRFSPVRNPQRALKRREVVLHQMEKNDFITSAEYDRLRVLPIDMSKYQMQDHNTGLATYFREYLRLMLSATEPDPDNYDDPGDYHNDSMRWAINPAYGWITKNRKPDGSYYNLYKDGLKIYTTINSRMQDYAEQAMEEHLGKDLQPAFYKHWKGNNHAPFDFTGPDKDVEINKLLTLSMHRSDRYRNLKKAGVSYDSIERSFNTKIEMRIFSWTGERDTIMSPIDSIRYYKYFLQAGLMSVEPQTGYVRAYVGGINFEHFKYDHVMMGRRQVGSTFKPFVYALAMQEGEFSPCSKVANIQYSVDLPSGDKWSPKNSSKYKEGQMVTLKEALANSINWISTFLIKRYSPAAVIKIVRKMGVTSPITAVPSIALGSADLSLYEMVGAMNTFANKGVYIQPIFITRIADKNGNVIANFLPNQDEAMSDETAYLMLTLMKGVVESGTGARLRYRYGLTNPIAGKTGTTQSNSDGWFMGLTPDLVTGVWVGGDDRTIRFRNTHLGQGANMALPIWALFMKRVYSDNSLKISKGDFDRPLHPLSVDINCATFNDQQSEDPNISEGNY